MLGMTILLLARRFGLAFGAAVLAFHGTNAVASMTTNTIGVSSQATGIAIGAAILGFFLPQVRVRNRDTAGNKMQSE